MEVTDALTVLVTAHGAGGSVSASPVQRIWRKVHVDRAVWHVNASAAISHET